MQNILVAGGDNRNIYLARILAQDGFKVSVCGFDEGSEFGENISVVTDVKKAASQSDVIVFGLPVSQDNITVNTPQFDGCIYLNHILANAKKDAIITGGRVSPEIIAKCTNKIVDYSKRDDFAYLNAVPTAEAAIRECKKQIPSTISGLKCAVTGFGKCAEILALALKSMNAIPVVFARSSKDLAHASALGIESHHLDSMKQMLKNFRAIFNTVPFGIFDNECIKTLNDDCVFIDIASAPGGIAEDTCKEKINYKFLPGLPGKYSPYTAAKIIKDVILTIIRESGKEAHEWPLTDSK